MTKSPRDRDYAIDTMQSSICKEITNGILWYRGHIYTPHGIVAIIYSEPRATMLHFVHHGRIYIRQWSRMFQPTYLVTLAKRFAAEVAERE